MHRFLHVWNLKKYKQNTTPRKPAPCAPALDVPSPHSNVAPDGEHDPGKHTLHHEPFAAPFCAVVQLPVQTTTVPALVSAAQTNTASPLREPRAWIPQLDSGDASRRHTLLADILFALGDSYYSFVINAALWNSGTWNGRTAACVRTAQTRDHVLIAQRMVRADAGVSSGDDSPWVSVLLDLLLAHLCTWDTDVENAGEKTEKIVRSIVFSDGQSGDRLRMLSPRWPHLDIPAYIFLRSTLMRYNSEHGGTEVDTQRVLRQFLNQQPAYLCGLETVSFASINCLPSCLKWCMEALHRNTTLPLDIPGTVESPAAGTYAVLCTLWHLWIRRHLSSSPPSEIATLPQHPEPQTAWEDNAHSQLGISATELLGTVVCMIMAALPKEGLASDEHVLDRALAGANALNALSPKDLVERFLNQVWATNRQLLALPAEEQESQLQTSGITAEAIEPFRRFVAGSLGIDNLPMLEQGAAVYPIVLADPGQSIS